MKVLTARNVHEALPLGLRLLDQEGIERASRNGPVKIAPWPVTTIYENPCERVLFWPQRDANPFFHLYESLWMIQGRDDLEPLVKYAKNMANFSDNGVTLHGAYGHRWRHPRGGTDQLRIIANTLKENPDDRRCILQMWDVWQDLGKPGKDLPCNTIASFQRDIDGRLDLTVFCRSNDIIWGAYGANAVHFSVLLEYMATWIGCPVGVYRQVSVNWHGYLRTLAPLEGCWQDWIDGVGYIHNPYETGEVHFHSMEEHDIEALDDSIAYIVYHADSDMMVGHARPSYLKFPWTGNVWRVLEAHEEYRKPPVESRFERAQAVLETADQDCDWVKAANHWLVRRAFKAAGKIR